MKYSTIDAWNELISTCYTEADKAKIERIIECIMLGLFHYIPNHWFVLSGGPGTGKSTLLSIISQILPDQWTPVSYISQDFGQYSKILAIAHDCDPIKVYENVKENWVMSKDTYFLMATNMTPEYLTELDDCTIITATGERVSFDQYINLMDTILKNIEELKTYFRIKAEHDFIRRSL